jgi:hypothetical protein
MKLIGCKYICNYWFLKIFLRFKVSTPTLQQDTLAITT